jgi:hypothetical protein
MDIKAVADIYAANARSRQRLEALLETISPEEAELVPDGGWSIKQIVEHVALVDEGTADICRRLLDKALAGDRRSDGAINMRPEFGESAAKIATMKLKAPDRVQPTGEVSFGESLARLERSSELFNKMRAEMETLDLSGATFAHPFMGELTAAEWLMVAGGHELRHVKQIERRLAELRQ